MIDFDYHSQRYLAIVSDISSFSFKDLPVYDSDPHYEAFFSRSDQDDFEDIDNIVELAEAGYLPEFGTYPAGTHKVLIKFKSMYADTQYMTQLQMKAVETIQLAHPEDAPLVLNAEDSALFVMDNKYCLREFMALMKQLCVVTGASTVSGIMAAADGMIVTVITSTRKSKYRGWRYTEIKEILI